MYKNNKKKEKKVKEVTKRWRIRVKELLSAWETVMETGNGVDARQIESLGRAYAGVRLPYCSYCNSYRGSSTRQIRGNFDLAKLHWKRKLVEPAKVIYHFWTFLTASIFLCIS